MEDEEEEEEEQEEEGWLSRLSGLRRPWQVFCYRISAELRAGPAGGKTLRAKKR